MNLKQSLIIAVDFDGTIVEDAYPEIGKPKLFAFDTLKKLQNEGHRLILWTYRSGKKLEEAVQFCESNGINFYAINASYEDEEIDSEKSRKIHADIFIDDRNVGGFIGWGNVHQLLLNQEIATRQTKGIFSFLKKR
ncbi:MAG: BT0820 family HAD-type phosphatase [Flavobacteriaceae bacterium]